LSSIGRDLTQFGVASLAELPLILFEAPNLVVLPQPARGLGTRAAQLLLERINGSTEPPRTVIVPGEGSETLASSW
jgi:LacI family transcriptional regulator